MSVDCIDVRSRLVARIVLFFDAHMNRPFRFSRVASFPLQGEYDLNRARSAASCNIWKHTCFWRFVTSV